VTEPGTLRFDGRVAIVTGAGAGLGRAHALLLAGRGAAVVVNDVDADGAATVVAGIVQAGGTAVADSNTVATPAGGEALVGRAVEAFGHVDIVVNNAGIVLDRSFPKTTPDVLDPVLDVHLRGAFHVTRPAWPLMRDAGYGRVVNTTSASGLYGGIGQTNYAAAKMGLVGLTRALALEGARHGITANAVAPLASTAMTEGVFGRHADRFDPTLVAPVVAWLAHETCMLTGEILTAGAGRVARVVIAETSGYVSETLTVEEVADHRELLFSDGCLATPTSVTEAIRLAVRGGRNSA
jgi:NAD(P)-dependent dehydrogenase (short-subunit alcohol dehydrogenase family)